MKVKWIVPLLAASGLLVALAAFAADTAKKSPAADEREVRREVVRIVESDDGEAGDELAWADEDLGLMAFGDEDAEGGPGDDGDRRIVIRRGPGMRGGMGMGMGRGMRLHRGMGMGRGMGRGFGMAFARLDLTDAQREKLEGIHERQQRKAIQARADLQIARMDLRKLMRADAPSATAINAQLDKLGRMRTEMQKSHVATFLEARALLTPEQLKQLRERGPRVPGARQRMRLHQPPPVGGQKSD